MKILVLYYTQTGQLRQILDSVVQDIKAKADIDFASFEPQKAFPFPYKASEFFDAMPETVIRIPVAMKPLHAHIFDKEYDLVILGYQPWFLNPSQPTTSFLKSDEAKKLLRGKPVVTVVGCRNMWLHGQEKVKEDLKDIGANLVGNIVLTDTNPNLVSLITIIRWAFSGHKEATKWLPPAGVQNRDIEAAQRFGQPIYDHLVNGELDKLQSKLLDAGAIQLNPGLVLLEKSGIKRFRFWAKFIREKGGPGDANRLGRVMLFKNLLLVGIFILSPISSLTAAIKLQIQKRALLRDVEYFKQLSYEKGRI